MAECRRIGVPKFLELYANGVPPTYFYVRSDGVNYPMKALWAASHDPCVLPRTFKPGKAMAGFSAFGFRTVHLTGVSEKRSSAVLDIQSQEGDRFLAEIQRLRRSAKIVAEAKAYYGPTCQACDFEFEAFYGARGKDYVECHHVNPLSGRDGVGAVTKIRDLAMLCANCHRMVHRSTPCLTVEELKKMIQRRAT